MTTSRISSATGAHTSPSSRRTTLPATEFPGLFPRTRGDASVRLWVIFLIVGYLVWTRSFAYIGIPQAMIVVGEIGLASVIALRPRSLNFFFLNRDASFPLRELRGVCVLFLLLGAWAVAWGAIRGYDLKDVVRLAGYHYYTLYLPIGVWMGVQYPELLERILKRTALLGAIYGVLWLVILNRILLLIPGSSNTKIFGQPGQGGIIVLAILSFGWTSQMWLLLLANAFVFLGVQMRAEWVGGLLGFGILFVLGKIQKQLLGMVVGGLLLFALAYTLDLKMAGPDGRDGEISARGLVARVLAGVDPDAASKMSGSDFSTFKGTVDWRTYWWQQIWHRINHSKSNAVFFLGEGFGYPIGDLGAYGTDGIRTPHNIFFFSLCYNGWVGAGSFILLQITVLYTMFKAYLRTGQCFGILFCVICIAMGLFGNFFETPYGAIPYYLVVGLCAARLFERPSTPGARIASPVVSAI